MKKSTKLQAFRENGKIIAEIRDELVDRLETEHKLEAIEELATKRIHQSGGEPAFKRVPGYHWSTCISVNDCIVHGIPQGEVKDGDMVTIDIGMYYKNTTTDTAKTIVIGKTSEAQQAFLDAGKASLATAISQAKPGNKIKNISQAMQQTVEKAGYNVSRDLVGHGLGESIHEEPPIPCFVSRDPKQNLILEPGMVLAIEIMYMMGSWQLYTNKDGWGMYTKDGSLSAQFEHDVIITTKGNEVITA